MNQNRITGQQVQVNSVQAKESTLKTGQIVEGKVAKLYPNQKALIQIGSKQMVAQLETALSVGERYHFQVKVDEGTVYLKVLGEQSAKTPDQDIARLLSKLGLQSGKVELAFTKNLLDSHIPVQKEQLRQAFSLLNESSNKSEAAQLIKTMIANKIPLTKDVFQALFTKETKGLNEVMKQALTQFVKVASGDLSAKENVTASKQVKGLGLETIIGKLQTRLGAMTGANQQINSSPEKNVQMQGSSGAQGTANTTEAQSKALQSAIETLSKMSDRPQFLASLVAKQLAPVLSENRVLFQAFKEAGLIKPETTMETWKNEWNSFIVKNVSAFKEAGANQAQSAKIPGQQMPGQTQTSSQAATISQQGSEVRESTARQGAGVSASPTSLPAESVGRQSEASIGRQAEAASINQQANSARQAATSQIGTDFRQGNAEPASAIASTAKQQVGPQSEMALGQPAIEKNVQSNIPEAALGRQSESAVRLSLPFNLTETEAAETLGKWVDAKAAQQGAVDRVLSQFSEVLKNAQLVARPLPMREFAALTKQIEQELMPLLPKKEAVALRAQMRNNPEMLMRLSAVLDQLSSFKTERPMLESMQLRMQNGSLFTLPQPKDQMLGAIRQMLDSSGISHEQQIAQGDILKAAQDLKSQLITLDRSGSGPVQEAGRQMLNFVNGMQLQSVTQTEHFIQASLMLPGGALGLSNDARLEFEGKRNEDGAINPEFCRILFYLELENIDETVIDMNVHKGNISVTVYNDHDLTSDVAKTLVPLLEEGLAGMEYKLASLTVKSRSDRTQSEDKTRSDGITKSDKGTGKVDYRV